MKKFMIIGLMVSLAGTSIALADMKEDLAKKLEDGRKTVSDGLNTAQEAAQRVMNPTIGLVERAIIEEVNDTPEYKAFCQNQTTANRAKLEARIVIAVANATKNHCYKKTDEFPFIHYQSGCTEGIQAAHSKLTKQPQ